MDEPEKSDVEKAVDELLTDPDSADKGHAVPPPRTIDANPVEQDEP